MQKRPNLGHLLTVAGFVLLAISLGLLQYPDDHAQRDSALIDQFAGTQAAQYTVDSLQLAVTQPPSIALPTDEIAALEAITLGEAQAIEHWLRLLKGSLKAVSGESLDSETTQPAVEATQSEVPEWIGAVATALATALEEHAQLEAQSVEQGLEVIESMGSVPEEPLDDDIDPFILTEEHEAALVAHAQLEAQSVEQGLEVIESMGSVPEESLDDDIDPFILTEEHEAVLAADVQLEMEETQRILKILTTISE